MNKKTIIDNGKKTEKQVKFFNNKEVEVKVNEESLKKLYNLTDKEYELIPNIGQMYEA